MAASNGTDLNGLINVNRDQWKKYKRYEVDVDHKQNDRATEIKICDFSRPHMRAFHCSWWAFFIAFFNWFAVTPLLGDIRRDLGISKRDVWTSSVVSVGGTIAIRFILGPMCDKFGARVLFSVVLCATAIPTACIGLIHSFVDLVIIRLCIGLAGGTFVMCEYWTSVMFADEIVGNANALVAGWGNLGAGVTQLVIGSLLYPLFKTFFDQENSEMAWRTVCIFPAIIAFVSGVVVYYISDDCPKGNYSELKKRGVMSDVSLFSSFKMGCFDRNSWILFIQYACCFGVELTMNNATTLYFRDQFSLSPQAAAAIASIFGWMNMFARAGGGFISDVAGERYGMQGRLAIQMIMLAFEGAFVLIFSTMDSLGSAILVLVFFSLFVQAAEGASYGIVPFVNPPVTGAISGIVGAGGNVGAVCFGLAFRDLNYMTAFKIMGATIFGSALLTFFIDIKGYSKLYGNNDIEKQKKRADILASELADDVTV